MTKSLFQRRHYEATAATIKATAERIAAEREAREIGNPIYEGQMRGVRRTAAHFADMFAADNPRFDAARFLTACGYGATTLAEQARIANAGKTNSRSWGAVVPRR